MEWHIRVGKEVAKGLVDVKRIVVIGVIMTKSVLFFVSFVLSVFHRVCFCALHVFFYVRRR